MTTDHTKDEEFETTALIIARENFSMPDLGSPFSIGITNYAARLKFAIEAPLLAELEMSQAASRAKGKITKKTLTELAAAQERINELQSTFISLSDKFDRYQTDAERKSEALKSENKRLNEAMNVNKMTSYLSSAQENLNQLFDHTRGKASKRSKLKIT